MKHIIRFLAGAGRISVTATAIAGLVLAGCGKPVTAPGEPTGGAPAVQVPRGAVKSAEPTSYYEVAAHLDPGGSLYGYLRTSQWLTGLSTNVGAWQELVLSLPSIPSADKEKLTQVFHLITNLIANSGLEEISGVGMSGIALEPGYYQTKFMVHRNPGAKSGYLWSVAGAAPRPLAELDLLPADTVWATFGDLSLAAVWEMIKTETSSAQIAEVIAGLNQLEAGIQKATGARLEDLLDSLGGQQGALLTLSSTRTVKVPVPTGPALEIPEPALLIAVKVKDDQLFNLIDRNLQNLPNIVRTEEEGLKARSVPVPVPFAVNLKPTIARHGEYLFLASNDELVRTVIEVKAGKQRGVKSSDEFKRLAKGMPAEGNSFTFVSERFADSLRQVQEIFLESAALNSKDGEEGAALLRKLMQSGASPSSYAVGSNLKDGWYFVSHGNQEPAQAILVPLAVAPAAIVAGMTLPALARAKEKAQSINCVNNLKQIGLAAKIWANDHNDRFPPNILAMTNELVSPRILICPQDPKGAPASLTWAGFNASQSSYEWVSPGLSDGGPDTATTVLARCKFHGHTCMADGSVRQSTTWGNR